METFHDGEVHGTPIVTTHSEEDLVWVHPRSRDIPSFSLTPDQTEDLIQKLVSALERVGTLPCWITLQ